MALFRRGLPRRATIGAFIGFVYALLILPTGDLLGFIYAPAIAWFLLSLSLLFGRSFSYYSYMTWAVLWIAWRSVLAFRGDAGPLPAVLLDVGLPVASLILLSSSGYLESLADPDADADPE